MAKRARKRQRKRRNGGRGLVLVASALAVCAVAALIFALDTPSDPPRPVAAARPAPPPVARSPAPARDAEPAAGPTVPSPSAPRYPPWLANAAPSPQPDGRPMIAVVIDDMGLNRSLSRKAAELRAPLTLSYLPYGEELPAQTAAARARGHELLVHLQMAPEAASRDAGPNALVLGLPPAELERRLDWALTRFPGFVGVNNHMGSRFTADEAGMSVVLSRLKVRGLLFLDSRTTPHTVGPQVARRIGLPFAERNVFLDNMETEDAVRAQIAELEAAARNHGIAVAIGHPKEATIAALAPWLETLSSRGFQLVPLSVIVRRNFVAERG
jgi:polysaccharide deacetylase 2 family uncharacterized protein YibQ